MITLNDAITASGAYPDRLKSPELTQEVKDNLTKLIPKVIAILKEIGVTSAKISSGFRPSGVNSSTKGAAKRSAHQTGEALDIIDDKAQTIATRCTPALLEKHGLYMEDKSATIGKSTNWCHLTDRAPKSGKRIFLP